MSYSYDKSDAVNRIGRDVVSASDLAAAFGNRLKLAIGNKSIRSVAQDAGVSEGTVRNVLKGGTPNIENSVLLANSLNVRVEWLAFGSIPMRPSAHGDAPYDANHIEQNDPHPDEYAYVPLYNIEASAGHGGYVETEEVASYLAFRRDWLHQEVHANPAHLHLIYVRGDSMEPALQSGEVVMVDTSAADESFRDGIYVIQVDSAVLIKRLQRLPGNRVRVMSNNAAYPSFEADLNNAEIKIIGRVIWHAGRI
ncbi:MAG: LexA family transcriptional regulator [Halothiobacillus sp.]